MQRPAALLAVLFAAIHLSPAQARLLPPFAPRALAIHADNVILAEPLDDKLIPERLRAREVIRGADVKPGETFSLEAVSPFDRQKCADEVLAGHKLKQRRIQQALVFVGRSEGGRGQLRFSLVGAGLCLRTVEGELLAPAQLKNPGPYVLTTRNDLDWLSMLQHLREDCAALDRLNVLKSLPPSPRRSRGLLEWVEQHRRDFGAVPVSGETFPARAGWEYLETEIFQWALVGSDPAAAWATVQLYAELNQGRTPPLHSPAFAVPAGRELLCRVAASKTTLEGDRLRALRLLTHPQTLGSRAQSSRSVAQPMSSAEQAGLVDRLIVLLRDSSAAVRGAAATAIAHVASPAKTTGLPSSRVLSALMAAYRKEPPGEARDAVAEAIWLQGNSLYWQELTGNPPGMLVRVCDLEHNEHKVHFWLQMRSDKRVVHECPTLILERLDPTGKVGERKQMPLPVAVMDAPWREGWNGRNLLYVELPTAGYTPGNWRLRIEGRVGQGSERMIWRAEPRSFTVEQPQPQHNPYAPGTVW